MDVQMPGMDGYELVELIRSNTSTSALPVIFVSAIFRPLIASLLLGVFVYGLAYLVTRELHRAALLAISVWKVMAESR